MPISTKSSSQVITRRNLPQRAVLYSREYMLNDGSGGAIAVINEQTRHATRCKRKHGIEANCGTAERHFPVIPSPDSRVRVCTLL